MKTKVLYSFFALILCGYVSAQVGVGTTNPDPSSMLDITATDKGVLVPRVNLTDVTDATAPINAPATGLLIWNTNAAVVGGSGTGFYFFNGVQWMPLMQLASDDADFYEEGTTAAPDNIADDMFTHGYVAIGKNTADHRLELNEIDNAATRTLSINSSANTAAQRLGIYNEMNVSGTGEARGMYNLISGADDGAAIGTYSFINRAGNGQHIGSYNFMDGDGSGFKYGTFNRMTGDNGFQYGTYNLVFSNTTGWRVGTYNQIGGGTTTNSVYGTINNMNTDAGSGQIGVSNGLTYTGNGVQIGVHNNLTNNGGAFAEQIGILNQLDGSSDAEMIGVDNQIISVVGGFGSGDKIGTRVIISNSIPGTHYGFYADVTKAGSYAAYLLGDVSIGTDGTDNYILPDSRGTNGQIMQTDGAGNVDWTDAMNPVSIIPIYSNDAYIMNNGAGQDLSEMDSSIEPTIFNTAGNIEVKLVIRYIASSGTNNFQLRAHDGTTEWYPIVSTDAWTYAATQTGGVATSPWKPWAAGTNASEVHVFGWNSSGGSMTIRNAYLMVRSQ